MTRITSGHETKSITPLRTQCAARKVPSCLQLALPVDSLPAVFSCRAAQRHTRSTVGLRCAQNAAGECGGSAHEKAKRSHGWAQMKTRMKEEEKTEGSKEREPRITQINTDKEKKEVRKGNNSPKGAILGQPRAERSAALGRDDNRVWKAPTGRPLVTSSVTEIAAWHFLWFVQ